MKYISFDNLHNFCRTCLKELNQRQKYKICNLDLEIKHWLRRVFGDDLIGNKTYPYPKYICHFCRNKLNQFLQFHTMCMESRRKTLQIVVNHAKIKIDYEYNSLNKFVISDCSLNNFEDDNNQDNNDLCSIEYDELNDKDYTVESLKTSIKSFDDLLFERNQNQTELKSDNQCNSEQEKNNQIKAKSENVASKVEEKIKKYVYAFRCDQCKYRCVSQQILDIHMRTHYGLKPYQCSKCEESFDKLSEMLKHLINIHGEKELTIICESESCGQYFNSSRSYKKHYRQNHLPQQIQDKQNKIAFKTTHKHVCEECGKVYTKLQTFKEHQYTHGPKDNYPYQCDECDKAFVKQRTFNEHKLRHAGVKSFECSQCGAKKTTKKELRSHMNSHTRERKYPCPNCSMVFNRPSNRRIHIDVVHHGIRRFACHYCDQTFGKGDNLKNHELLHTGEKPHSCEKCGKRFVQRVSLRSHMKTHHK